MDINKGALMEIIRIAYSKLNKAVSSLFPKLRKKVQKPITERVKTFKDAYRELGEEHPFVKVYIKNMEATGVALDAYTKLCVICAALNEGWIPTLAKEEQRWYPWFVLLTEEELKKKVTNGKAKTVLCTQANTKLIIRLSLMDYRMTPLPL